MFTENDRICPRNLDEKFFIERSLNSIKCPQMCTQSASLDISVRKMDYGLWKFPVKTDPKKSKGRRGKGKNTHAGSKIGIP